MIRIIIDPQIFITQNFGGISRYYTELCIAFEKNKDVEILLPILYSDNIHFKASPLFTKSYQNRNKILITFSELFRAYLPRRLKKRSLLYTLDQLEKKSFELFIPSYYDPYFLSKLNEKPFVLTVHDMIHELYPEHFREDKETALNKRILLYKATKIIAVSENTRKDILTIYPQILPDKIEVVYLAHQFSEQSSGALSLPEHYILFVGNRKLYKNFLLFIHALAPLFKEYGELNVVCAGGNSFDETELELLQSLDISSRVYQRNFKDAELKSYYERAKCFVFPSAYEGFGIPILESMSAGCPIILTNNSSFPEIAGDAGIYFKLNDKVDLRNKLKQVWNNPEIRLKHKQKGIEQALKFNWEKTARETLNVYQKALHLASN
jgi:glycosyltransferase involved in cell wall biosynthesis